MQEPVNIKGTRHGLIIRLGENEDFEAIKRDLRHKMESSRGFFRGARFTLHRALAMAVQQREELERICQEFGMIPDLNIPSPGEGARVESKAENPGESALLTIYTLRSGQRIAYPGHIVVIGDVNAGAELSAGGSIVVLGACRGAVSAGTRGDTLAQVMAFVLEPLRLSIAGIEEKTPAGGPESGLWLARVCGGQIVREIYRRFKS